MKYLINLDETLVDTTTLNNDAYNYALEKFGFDRIITTNRITRDNIFTPDIKTHNQIVELKQKYFIENWLKYRVAINHILLDKIKIFGKQNCLIWTKANKERANAIIYKCELESYFNDIIFDNKESLTKTIDFVKPIVKTNNLIIYENNHKFFSNSKSKIVDEIKYNNFNIKGYKVGSI